jgi:flagellar biosynthesis/type III secretory pathway M-ring protein FliF/YscJ
MRKMLYLPMFVLAFSLTYAWSQTGNSNAAPAQSQPPSTNPATPAATPTSPEPSDTLTGPDANNAASNSELQSQIQNALKNEPTLANASISVNVSDEQIDVSGAVPNAREKLTAKRIVQSYAGNRKVKERITLENPSSPATTDNSSKPAGNKPPRK